MTDLYAVMIKAAANPDAGLLRQHRAAPFLVVSARQHFMVYDRIPLGIAILTVLHQVRDFKGLISGLSSSFLHEIEKLKTMSLSSSQKRGKNL